MKEIVITVDSNDGDYNTAIHDITEKNIEKFKPLIKAISESGLDHNFDYGEYADSNVHDDYKEFDPELIDEFADMCPYGEHGFHSIEYVYIQDKPKRTYLLK